MKLRTGALVLLCLALLFAVIGCGEEAPTETTTMPTEDPLAALSAQEYYEYGRTLLQSTPNLTVTMNFEKTRQVNRETYSEKMVSTMSFRDQGTSQVAASVKQDVSFGTYPTQYVELYSAGKAYCQISGSTFQANNMAWKDFLSRQIPVAVLDSSAYGSVTSENLADRVVTTFTLPYVLESWVCDDEDAVLVTASGTATSDTLGNLLQTTYTAQYTIGETVYHVSVTADVSIGAVQTLDADLATIPTECPTLSYFDAPRRILQVVGDVYTSKSMSVEYTESLYSAAYARRRSQTSAFDTYGTGSEFMACSRYEVSLLDYSNTAEVNSEVVTFLDGVCTSSINGAEPTIRNNVSAQQMREYCEDSILAALFTPNHLLDAKVSDNGEFLCIRFTGNEAFANNLCSSIYNMFGANLDHYAESFTTPTAEGYLCISKHTGLPTALGVALSRVHVIEGVSCQLNYQLDQTMQLSSATAYETITGEPMPDASPDQTAAPLFYKVTGVDGKTMWLLGTVHVGDARAERLPQKIYDAFAESAALAVEFNINTFEDSLLADPALMQQLSEAYYYSDGTTVADHLEKTLLQKLQDMILVSGCNDTNAQLYRTVIWWNLLSDFYLQQDSMLSADMGVDQILLDMAEASEKPVLEIESGLSQIQMLAGFSDELQAMLLEELLMMDTHAYSQEIRAEYEAWCRGDAEALEKELTQDTADMSEADLALLDEYNKAMYTDRNAAMLSAALQYLSGEETVFYAVGYAHLLGETGLIQGLQNAGYTVELVTY